VTARVASLIAAILLLGVVIFQIALVLGAPWGAWTQGGQTEGTLSAAGRVLAAISAGLLIVMALSVLARSGFGPFVRLPRRLITMMIWFTTIYSALGVVMNAVSSSAPERWAWTPITASVLVCCVIVIRGTRSPQP
jgi:hypothetical protein